MTILKFSNVKYYRGGGKTPYRLRHNQNYNVYVRDEKHWLNDWKNFSDDFLVRNLNIISNGKVSPTSTTTLKRIKR